MGLVHLHGMPVYAPAFASSKLYSSVTKAHWCEKLVQDCDCHYLTALQPGLKLVTIESLVLSLSLDCRVLLLLHQPFHSPMDFAETTQVSWYQKDKTNLDLLKQEIVSDSVIS